MWDSLDVMENFCRQMGSFPRMEIGQDSKPSKRFSFGDVPSGKLTVCYRKSPCLMGKLTISMAIFNGYFDITRGFVSLPICGVELLHLSMGETTIAGDLETTGCIPLAGR